MHNQNLAVNICIFNSDSMKPLVFSLGEVMLQAMTSVSVLSTTVTSGKYTPCVQPRDVKARASSSFLEATRLALL